MASKYEQYKEEWTRLYHEEDWTQAEIADEYGCSDATVSRWFGKWDVETKSRKELQGKYYQYREEWRRLYVEENQTVYEIADAYGTGNDVVWWHLNKIGVETDPYEHRRKEREIVECKACGEEFEALPSREREYCSTECSYEGQKKKWVEKTCPVCQEDFEVKPSHLPREYCSNDCWAEAHKNRVQLTCPECGDEFEVPQSGAGVRTYCSRECQTEARTTRESRECEVCGDEFLPIAGNASIYCSIECHGRDSRERESVTCEHCGEEFEETPYWAERRSYCSKDCAYSAREVAPERLERGTRSAIVGAGEDIDYEAKLEAQGGECIYCGDDITEGYDEDHKRPLSRGGEHTSDNVHLTCPHCNRQKCARTHQEYIEWREERGIYIHHLALDREDAGDRIIHA